MKTVAGSGSLSAQWAIVGEAPGYYEDKEGKPFVGPSGRFLRESLERVGLEEGYFTNVVKIRPPHNATPGKKEVREHRQALVEELAALPNLRGVVLVGNTPLFAWTGLTGITKHRGIAQRQLPEFEELGLTVYATVHPAAVLRNRNTLTTPFLQDLAAFRQALYAPKDEPEVLLVDDPVTFEAFRLTATPQHIMKYGGGRAALDIETTTSPSLTGTEAFWVDLFIEGEGLLCLGCCFDGNRVWVFRDDAYLQKARPLLEAVEWTMHNGYFDRLALHAITGIDLKLKHDTMAMAYLLNPEERKGLEILSSIYLGLPPYKGIDYENIEEESFDDLVAMNARDVQRTWKLYRVLGDRLNKQPQLLRLYRWLLMPAINELIEVTRSGVPVDQARLRALGERLQVQTEELLKTLQSTTPPPEKDSYPDGWPHKRKADPRVFNPASFKQVGHVLYDLFALPVLEETEKGAPSTKSDVLAQLLESIPPGSQYTYIHNLRTYRGLVKMVGSFVKAWPKLISPGGLLHPRYKPLHVVTGRLSSQYPNIMQVPRDKEVRSVFVAPPGMQWVKADLSQIELRLAAWLAQEETMLDAFSSGRDLHTLTAKMVLGESSAQARQVGKTLNFGLLYGAGPGTLRRVARQDYGITLTQAQAWQYKQQFFALYPGLQQWHHNVEAQVMRDRKATSPLGRVRFLPNADRLVEERLRHAAVREGINHPVQSFASDILLHALTVVGPQLRDLGGRIIAEVHDEIDALVPLAQVAEAGELLRSAMQDTLWLRAFGIMLDVPVLAEVTTGPCWGELEVLV